jgi:hypothetical protein
VVLDPEPLAGAAHSTLAQLASEPAVTTRGEP